MAVVTDFQRLKRLTRMQRQEDGRDKIEDCVEFNNSSCKQANSCSALGILTRKAFDRVLS